MKQLVSALVTALSVTNVAAADEALPAGNATAGATVFAQCSACHAVGPTAQKGIGPVLNGVMGRRAATSAGYRYSAALRNSALTWDEATLAHFLRAPEQVVPGTKMAFPGLASSQDIADVIAYLKQYAADGQAVLK
jgi:cytochrome c